ncbi:MAG TPA: 4-hydroxyphenylacetate 3-hydroxylase N-terminal domain-containing protein [Chloroflexota bacterium]
MAVDDRFPTGAQFVESRDDGRQVWSGGEKIGNVATHAITRPVVDALAEWYDAHRDPAWRDKLLDQGGRSLGLKIPLNGDDIWALQETIRAWAVRNAGHITHTPVEAHTILLAIRDCVHAGGNQERIHAIDAYRDRVEQTGLLATVPFAPPQTDRFRPPPERITPKVVRETDGGIVVSGALGLGTSIAYVDDVLCTPTTPPITTPERAVWFTCPVKTPGVRIVARKPSIVTDDRFAYPLSSRYDELDCTVTFQDVFIPWENVFAYRDVEFCNTYMFQLFDWAVFHHLSRKLAHAEFLVGLAIAVAKVQGIDAIPGVQDDISELIVGMETLRTALRAAAVDARPRYTEAVLPAQLHTLNGSIYAIKQRARLGEMVRNLAGYGGLLSPASAELEDPELGPSLAPSYEGGGSTARQRAALLHLLNDATASALDGREAAFTAMATGGLALWKLRVQLMWHKHNELAQNVLSLLPDWQGNDIDFSPPNPMARRPSEG